MSIFCDNNDKQFKNWKRNESSKELIKFVSSYAQIRADDLLIEIKGGKNVEIRGTYVHPKLAPHIASWISPKIAVMISDIVNHFLVN